MALYLFTRSILEGRPIDVFNEGPDEAGLHLCGRHCRGVLRVMDRPLPPNPEWNGENRIRVEARRPIEFTTLGMIDRLN